MTLSRWGQSMGLSGELEDLQALKRTLGLAQEVEQAKSRLDQILQLFIDAGGVSKKPTPATRVPW
jgi:hypothetical protein